MNYGESIKSKIEAYKKNKLQKKKEQDKAKEKELKQKEKEALSNRNAEEKMRDNFAKYKNKLSNAFSNKSYSSSLAYSGNINLPKKIESPLNKSNTVGDAFNSNTQVTKQASELNSRSHKHILNIIQANRNNIKLANIIRKLEYINNKLK